MNFEHTEKTRELQAQVRGFMQEHIYPNESQYEEQVAADPWNTPPLMEDLKVRARERGLWNLFLPVEHGEYSGGLTNLEYAVLAEEMGRVPWSSEAFNCSAPDTGNMEVLAKYGSEAQKKQWLEPLLNGEIRSAYAMTEPGVASSDATNISTQAVLDGDEWVINGEKHYVSGAGDPRCKIMIVMVKTDPEAPKHLQQSQILVPS